MSGWKPTISLISPPPAPPTFWRSFTKWPCLAIVICILRSFGYVWPIYTFKRSHDGHSWPPWPIVWAPFCTYFNDFKMFSVVCAARDMKPRLPFLASWTSFVLYLLQPLGIYKCRKSGRTADGCIHVCCNLQSEKCRFISDTCLRMCLQCDQYLKVRVYIPWLLPGVIPYSPKTLSGSIWWGVKMDIMIFQPFEDVHFCYDEQLVFCL